MQATLSVFVNDHNTLSYKYLKYKQLVVRVKAPSEEELLIRLLSVIVDIEVVTYPGNMVHTDLESGLSELYLMLSFGKRFSCVEKPWYCASLAFNNTEDMSRRIVHDESPATGSPSKVLVEE